jgi:hypothetical protein
MILEADEYGYSLHMQGHCSTLPIDEPSEAVRLLREAVKEVTGRGVKDVERPRIGFLP